VTAFGKVVDSPGSRLVLVPMEATAMAGGITQAMELLRAPPTTPSAPPPAMPSPFAGSPFAASPGPGGSVPSTHP
jgi:hypothetical protein